MWPLCYVPALQVHTLPVHLHCPQRPQVCFRTLPASYQHGGGGNGDMGGGLIEWDVFGGKCEMGLMDAGI